MYSANGQGWHQGGGGLNQNQQKKRSLDDDSDEQTGKKNPLEVMQMVIMNSQREIQNKTSAGLPNDPQKLTQIFTRQQMLLELQTEMMAQLSKVESAGNKQGVERSSTNFDKPEEKQPNPKPQSLLDLSHSTTYPMDRSPKMTNQDFYYGFNMSGQTRGRGDQGGMGGVRFDVMGRNINTSMGQNVTEMKMGRGGGTFNFGLGGPRMNVPNFSMLQNLAEMQMGRGGPGNFGLGGPGMNGPNFGLGGRGRDESGVFGCGRDFPVNFSPAVQGTFNQGMGRFGDQNNLGPQQGMVGFRGGDGFGQRGRFGPVNFDMPGVTGRLGSQRGMDDRGTLQGRGGRDMDNFGRRDRGEMNKHNHRDNNPLNRPYGLLPVEDRITVMKKEIFKYDNFPQSLRVIETARHNCLEAHIRTIYEDEPLDGERYRGFLMMNGVLVAVEEGKNKLDAKVNCYTAALYILIVKPIGFIFHHSYNLYDKAKHPSKSKRQIDMCDERMNWMLEAIYQQVRELPKNYMNRDFEEIVYSLELSITHIYKRTKTGFSCDFYVDDLLVASAQSKKKPDTYTIAVRMAKDKLGRKPSKNLDLLEEDGRLRFVDFHSEDIIDIRYGENKQRVSSNLEELKKRGIKTSSLLEVKDNLILIVPTGVSTTPWNMIEETCLANKIHMEIIENSVKKVNRCVVYMQGQLIADSYSSKPMPAKPVAMGRAKEVLMKKHKTGIKIAPVDYEKVTMTFEQIVEKATELSKSEPNYLNDSEPPQYCKADTDPEPDEMSRWVDAFLEITINSYNETKGLDDLILSHLPSYHSQILTDKADEMSIAVQTCRYKNVPYSIIQKHITKDLCSQTFLDYLSSCPSQTSGRYKLVEFDGDSNKKDN